MKFSRKQVIISAGILGTIVAVVLVWLFFFQSDQGDKTPPIVSQEATVQENADDIRIRHLTLLEKTLSAAISSGKNIPEPERAVYVSFGKTPLIVQGYAGQGLFDALGLNTLVNPDGTQYAYALNADKTKFQFFASVDDLEKGNVLL